jgi:general secretion pathway protein G
MFERYQKIQERRALGEQGFTLIELLIVIVILGILVAIVLFAVGGFTSTSAKAACQTDVKQVTTAASADYAQTGAWPAALADLSPKYMQTLPATTQAAAITAGSHYFVTYSGGAVTATNPKGTYDDGAATWAGAC